MMHADVGYSRRVNVGGWLVRCMVLIYLPDDTNLMVHEMGCFEGGRCWGSKVESCF